MIDPGNYPAIRKEIYFSEDFSDVAKELVARSRNNELDVALNEYWRLHKIPHINFLEKGPYAILSRSVASPNSEQKHFLQFARKNNLTPVILEYDGKLVTRNLEKLYLCKLHFYDNEYGRQYIHPQKIHIADMNIHQGRNMSEIRTIKGQALIDFHHGLFYTHADANARHIYNFTEWFNQSRVLGPDYYFFFLLISMKNAVLFDNYTLSDPSESRFLENKILPSIRTLQEKFGLRPLIFPLVPIATELDMRWLSYDGRVQKEVEHLLGIVNRAHRHVVRHGWYAKVLKKIRRYSWRYTHFLKNM